MNHTPGPWYAKTINSGSPHEQALIIDETTGANVAVSYDPKDASLIAAAPEMLLALIDARESFMAMLDAEEITQSECVVLETVDAAIATARRI